MQDRKIGIILFITFWLIYLLTSIGTLAMLFLGFGTVLEGERDILVNVFLVESGIAVIALFYSVFGLKKNGKDTEYNSKVDDKLFIKLKNKDALIIELREEIESLSSINQSEKYEWKYRDAVMGLCSSKSDMKIPDLVKQLEIEGPEKLKLFNEIGRLKRLGVLINDSVLYPDSIKIAKNG